MSSFAGQKILITGGSSGIGRAAAVQLAGQGAHVAVAARDTGRLDETVAACKEAAASADQRFTAVAFDVRDRDAVRAGTAEAITALGGLDVLICNSGYAVTGYLHELPDEAFDDLIQVNYMGHVNVVRALLPHFMEQRGGHICLVSSVLGFLGFMGYGPYAASKHAVVGFGHCLRQEMIPHDVQVSQYYPTTTDTPGLARENEDKPPETWAIEGSSKAMSAEQAAADLLKHVASGRYEGMKMPDPWYIWIVNRWAPSVVRMMMDGDLRKFLAKRSQG
jgi:3-dehydrosphinganine reductase